MTPKDKLSFRPSPPYGLFLLLLPLFLRLAGIRSRPIWYDEAFAILFSEKGLAAMVYGTLSQSGAGSADIHPLGYYAILWLWTEAFGRSVPAARLLSVFISLITLLLVYRISARLFNEAAARTAAVIYSILPFQIHFAQEIRMYALLSLWLMLATYSFLCARAGNRKWWIVFAAACALAQYTHNLAAMYLIPLAITPLIQKDWKTLRSLILAGLAALILYLPWLIHLPSQLSKVSAHYWVEQPGLERVFTLLLFYLPHLPLPEPLLLPAMLLAAATIALAAFQTHLAWKNKQPGVHRGIWLAYLAFAPPALLWIASQFVPVYIERALLPSHAVFCVWLAWALTQTKIPRIVQGMMAVSILAAAVVGIYQHIAYKGFPYAPYADLSAALRVGVKPGDVVVHSNKLSYLPLLYHAPSLPQGFIIDPPGSSVDTLAPATREVLRLNEYENIEPAVKDAPRIWFLIYRNSIEEYTTQGYSDHPHLEYLKNGFTLQELQSWGDLRVYLFVRPSDHPQPTPPHQSSTPGR